MSIDQSAVSTLELLREGAYVAKVLARLLDAFAHALLRLLQSDSPKPARPKGDGCDLAGSMARSHDPRAWRGG